MDSPPEEELHSFKCQAHDLLARASSLLAAVDKAVQAAPRGGKGSRVEGLGKYRAVIKSEERFLRKLVDNPSTIRGPHVCCSNVPYLAAVWHLICTEPGVTNVYRTFNYAETAGQKRREAVRVDVVAGNGRRWVKVKASALKSFNNDLNEAEGLSEDSDDDSGDLSSRDESMEVDIPIYAQARVLMKAAEQNLYQFDPPTIVMKFLGNEEVDARILETLQSMGVVIERGRENAHAGKDLQIPLMPISIQHDHCLESVNLDVTTLIALVADIAHEKVPNEALDTVPLQLQASQEKAEPLLPILDRLLHGRKMHATQTALRKFVDILYQLGGPTECERARNLIAPGAHADEYMAELDPQRALHDYPARPIADTWKFGPVVIVPDEPSERFTTLLPAAGDKGRKFQQHHLAVFGTADRHRWTTVTANAWIERALVDVGLGGLSIFSHDPRSLVERRVKRYERNGGA
ncbi:hypothetical protein HDU86_004851 [Geranomyces michiganensis]|nr:hypothetical protein HDU86_004851 [Geranomyces michiganensis]